VREPKGVPVYYCYILLCADDSFYVGVTDDPAQRVQDHNDGRGASWTAAHRPVLLVWKEEHPTLSAARQRENQLKRWSREKKDFLVRGSPRLRSGQGA
jgi:putative endonuclease